VVQPDNIFKNDQFAAIDPRGVDAYLIMVAKNGMVVGGGVVTGFLPQWD
jgi:hypothetical protein